MHLRQQLPKEQQDLLNHSWGVLRKGRGRSRLSWLLTAPVQVRCVSSRCYLGLPQRTQGLQQFVLQQVLQTLTCLLNTLTTTHTHTHTSLSLTHHRCTDRGHKTTETLDNYQLQVQLCVCVTCCFSSYTRMSNICFRCQGMSVCLTGRLSSTHTHNHMCDDHMVQVFQVCVGISELT